MGRGIRRSRPTGLFFVLSGSSGAGKDAVLNRMRELGYPFHYVVTVTTRPRRAAEKDGIDYYFTSESRFQEMVRQGELLEWAQVYGNYYGVPKQQVRQALEEGKDAIVRVDVQGAATIRNAVPQAVLIFLTTASVEDYEERLRQRKTESDTELKLRIDSIGEETKSLLIFDYIVMNRQGQLDTAVSDIALIITAEKRRTNPRSVKVT
ncbi:MAG: guanylate kinase [Chloroflexi bacterium]|nr:guanylate kinase [Chloroflexota bacterium]